MPESATVATSANMILHNSKRPQRSAATKVAGKLTQIEDSSSEDTPKKKSPAAFQLTKKVIPDDATSK